MESVKPIYFYDTMTGQSRLFETIEPGLARIYSCGPTVYNYAHIGNFRNFVFVDVLRRTLKLFGYQVKHVMNITDIDDKIIRNAAAEGVSCEELARRFESAFFDDCKQLNLDPMEFNPRATEHIPEMIDLVQRLIDRGYTYEADGSIYFKISQFPSYGKLSGIRPEEMQPGTRVDSDEYSKENMRDFVLWKGKKPGEPFWDTPFGQGRPGWHLECSAMSSKYLGESFDIHTGAEDLVFPHHENEIAQSEAASGKTFVGYWLHCAFLNMRSEKMSKSLGNIVTVHDLVSMGVDMKSIRYFLLSVHYRKPLNYTEESIDASHAAVARLQGFYNRVRDVAESTSDHPSDILDRIQTARTDFFAGLADDLNTARALGALFELVRDLNPLVERRELKNTDARTILELLDEANRVLAILDTHEEMLPDEIERLIQQRQDARKARDFKRADTIRIHLADRGIQLEDTREGVRWRKV